MYLDALPQVGWIRGGAADVVLGCTSGASVSLPGVLAESTHQDHERNRSGDG
jgi:hypothetical protein